MSSDITGLFTVLKETIVGHVKGEMASPEDRIVIEAVLGLAEIIVLDLHRIADAQEILARNALHGQVTISGRDPVRQ